MLFAAIHALTLLTTLTMCSPHVILSIANNFPRQGNVGHTRAAAAACARADGHEKAEKFPKRTALVSADWKRFERRQVASADRHADERRDEDRQRLPGRSHRLQGRQGQGRLRAHHRVAHRDVHQSGPRRSALRAVLRDAYLESPERNSAHRRGFVRRLSVFAN